MILLAPILLATVLALYFPPKWIKDLYPCIFKGEHGGWVISGSSATCTRCGKQFPSEYYWKKIMEGK